jgi:DNA-binding NarL/FixJ family response regulator
MTRVLIIDDHPIVLHGCRRILQDAGVREVLEASSVKTGYRLFLRHRPDMLIIDLALQGSGLGGLGLIQRVRVNNPRIPILVFSMHTDPVIVSRALEAGATGYLLKDTAPEDLIDAFDALRAGRPYLNHRIAVQMALLGTRGQGKLLSEATPRELQTLALLAEGKSYGQIAEDLGVSYKTVANTCSRLKMKLGAQNFPGLIRMAIEYLSTSPDQLRQAASKDRVT